MLRDVAMGEVVTVLSRGKPVATIAPVRLNSEQRQSAKRVLLARLSQQKALGKRSWSREQLYEG